MIKTINGITYHREFLVETLNNLKYLLKTHVEVCGKNSDDDVLYYQNKIAETQAILSQF